MEQSFALNEKTTKMTIDKTGKTFIVLDIISEVDCSYGEIYISFMVNNTINPAAMLSFPLISLFVEHPTIAQKKCKVKQHTHTQSHAGGNIIAPRI